MDLASFASLTGIGLIGGFLAGFLGIGGGVIMIPLLLYVAALPMKLATGLSMAQAFAATASGVLFHLGTGTVDVRLGVVLGAVGLTGALIGSVVSAAMEERTLLVLYFLLVVIALALLLFGVRNDAKATGGSVSLTRAVPVGLGVGVMAGMLGVGGGFILIPLMIRVLQVPIKTSVGTSLLALLAVTLAGGAGKIATGQFDLPMAIALVLGSAVGAQLGGRVNTIVSGGAVRRSLILLLMTIMSRTAVDLLGI